MRSAISGKDDNALGIPTIETARLIIREFTHADGEAYRQLMADAFGSTLTAQENEQWLTWTILSYREFDHLHQPPYGIEQLF
jgi:hypothetical protein